MNRPRAWTHAHYLEEAEELCERVAFIREGEVLAEGSMSDLMTRFGGRDLEEAYIVALA